MRNQPQIQASILDRLIDYEPGLSGEPVQKRFATLNQVRESLTRDLEHLLNTRRCIHPVPELDKQVRASVFSYGVRDFVSQNPRSPSALQQIGREIERVLALFEPRLKNATVRFETRGGNERVFRFRITALLSVDPVAAPVTFDTCFDINSGAYSIIRS
jgi:type VI secretion system protein ImpF